MKIKKLKLLHTFVIVLILLVVGFGLYLFRSPQRNFFDNATCALTGGIYEERFGPGGGYGRYYCVYTFSDAGKACKSSDECLGDCLVENGLDNEDPSYVVDLNQVGRCEKTNRFSGCYPKTIENPIVMCE